MIKINLLPWREQRRQVNKVRFGMIAAVFAGLAVFCVLTLHLYYRNIMSQQDKRKVYIESILNTEQAQLGKLNVKIRDLKVAISNLNFLFALKVKSYEAVDALDQLVRVVPEGVVLSKLIREDNALTLMGMAKTDLQVTSLMESINNSQLFQQPVLTEISGKETIAGIRYFILKVKLENPNNSTTTGESGELLSAGMKIKWQILA